MGVVLFLKERGLASNLYFEHDNVREQIKFILENTSVKSVIILCTIKDNSIKKITFKYKSYKSIWFSWFVIYDFERF